MSKHKQVYTPWQYAISNVIYAACYLAGIVIILGVLAWGYDAYRPRLFGEVTDAYAISYHAYDDKPENGKYVNYSIMVDYHVYSEEEQDVSEAVYAARPDTFDVWYNPDNPGGTKYAAVRDQWVNFSAFLFLVVGILFLWLPGMGRKIDAAIESGHLGHTMKGCVCGLEPTMHITVDATSRLNERVRGTLVAIAGGLLVFILVVDRSMESLKSMGTMLLLIVAAYLVPLVWRYHKSTSRRHSFACRLRQAWFWSVYD